MNTNSIDIHKLAGIAREAGKAILAIYNDPAADFNVSKKADDSPLTAADRASNQVIVTGLEQHFSHIPILSEEGKAIDYETRSGWERFWLVDPLDGTKEFIKRNGEFTVNIALIEGGEPVLGVVYVPVLDRMFVGNSDGAFELDADGNQTPIKANVWDETKAGLKVVASRSHPSPELAAFLDTFAQPELVNMGSSLKILLIATGEADIYPRLGPTMEWDTAAAHAVVAAAGGSLTRHDNGEPLTYNKESLLNPWFVATGL
jgi:3'(2'), 5'-bisphosphate nucleotidase